MLDALYQAQYKLFSDLCKLMKCSADFSEQLQDLNPKDLRSLTNDELGQLFQKLYQGLAQLKKKIKTAPFELDDSVLKKLGVSITTKKFDEKTHLPTICRCT